MVEQDDPAPGRAIPTGEPIRERSSAPDTESEGAGAHPDAGGASIEKAPARDEVVEGENDKTAPTESDETIGAQADSPKHAPVPTASTGPAAPQPANTVPSEPPESAGE